MLYNLRFYLAKGITVDDWPGKLKSFDEMLKLYFGTKHQSRWQRLKTRIWLQFQPYADRIQWHQKQLELAKQRSEDRMREMISKPSVLLKMVKRDDGWQGGTIVLPLNIKEK